MRDNQKVYKGDQVKMLDGDRVGGYLVRFTTPEEPDLYGDFFTAKSWFGRVQTVDLYYDHGFDGMLKGTPIGTASLKFDDVGVWMEAQIKIADEYAEGLEERTARDAEKALKSLVELGKLGLSSGAVSHLVKSEPVGDAYWISRWPIGEASLTPRPAEPKNKVQSLKSFVDTPSEVDLGSVIAQIEQGSMKADKIEVHFHNHNAAGDSAAQSTKEMADEAKEQVKSDESVLDIDSLVSDRVAEAMKAAQEEREAKEAAKAAEEKRIEDEVEARLKKYAESRTVTAMPTFRANGIVKDDFPSAFKYFLQSKGDTSGLKGLPGVNAYGREFDISLEAVQNERSAKGLPLIGSEGYKSAVKASNATDMNIGTAADGGSTVPTGFYNQIIMRRDEVALHNQLGCTSIPGVGTTVDVPIDNEADGEFVSTSEANQFDEDAPAVTKVSMTLVKYSKRTLISDELLQDSGINILGYVQDRVAIGWGKTINNLLVTEAVTGTQYVRGGTTSGFAFGEIEQVVYNSTVAPYLSDAGDVAFVGRAPTYGTILQITGNDRQYGVPQNMVAAGLAGQRSLLGYPFFFSQKVDAIGARGKSLLFGAWSNMLYRESPSLNFLYDPYTLGDYGQARLLWYMRWDFELAQSGAVGYFEHDLT